MRAISGAYLFGVPLLYTMEMWWLGRYVDTGRLLLILAVALVANFGLACVAGFKQDRSLGGTLEQTINAVAVGAVAAAVVLLVLNRIGPHDPPQSVLGLIVVQALPLSIGASLANAVFARGERRQGHGEGGHGSDHQGETAQNGEQATDNVWNPLLNDVGATTIGAVFVSATIAPTDEVPMLAARLQYPHLLALIALSLLVGYAIVFASGFDPRAGGQDARLFQHPATETTLSYLVSLAVAAGILFLFRQIGSEDQPFSILQQTLVLGLPATVGGAAGRIVV